jgi:chemotaxis protein MotB
VAHSLLQPRPTAEDEGNYLVSVSDLMVGMLFIFIIILMAFALNFRIAQDDATSIQGQLARERDEVARELRRLAVERDLLALQRDTLAGARDHVAGERDRLAAERDQLAAERDRLAAERDRLAGERDELGAVTDYLLRDERIRSAMLAAVQALLRERRVEVSLDPANGILRLPESLLFDSARAVLRPEGERALRELAAVLARSLPCYSRAPRVQQIDCRLAPKPLLEAVLVEGHTDTVPISTAEFADNWQLASARAINTYKALLGYESSLAQLKNARGEDLLGVSAYEAHRPVAPETTTDGRRLNRRIDLRFLIAAPSVDEVSAIRGRVEKRLSP